MDVELDDELNSRTIVPWSRVLQQLGLYRLLRRRCAENRNPMITFSRKSRGLLLSDVDRLILACAKPCTT